MAHILNGTLPIVNVDYLVGGSAPNRRDDVMLVQGLLLTWAWDTELSASERNGTPSTAKDIDLNAFRVDGHFGQATRNLLRAWVADSRAKGNSAEGWVMPQRLKAMSSPNGYRFMGALGGLDMAYLADIDTPEIKRDQGRVDTARGTYQRYGLFCLGWHVPPELAASLAHRRMKPQYTPREIDI